MALAEIAYTRDQIRQRIEELAEEIRSDLNGERPVLVSILKGSVVFLADLVRALKVDADIDFISISSYGGEVGASGVVRIVKDLEDPIEGRHVVLVEDIVDTGFTLSYLLRTLKTQNPASVRVCALIDKTVRRIADPQIDYAGFRSEEFLIGYGLDFQGRYRNLPHLIAVTDIAALAAQPDVLNELFQGSSG
ncbi:MAG: hypoxanthine phosphoribosyltransferase [Actinomycetota bacterium]